MKTIDKTKNYRCLDCGGLFRGRVALPVWWEFKVSTYKCPMCRGGRFELCNEEFEGELVWPAGGSGWEARGIQASVHGGER